MHFYRRRIFLSLAFMVWITGAASSGEISSEEQAIEVVKDTSFSVQLGANVGLLALDAQIRNFYSFVAGSIGLALLTEGDLSAVTAGAGYTFALSKPSESMWFMDALGLGSFGWRGMFGKKNNGFGMGVGLGFRYLHRSGFTMGFKIPLLGGVFNRDMGVSENVGSFFLDHLMALPVVSLGYRF